MLSRFSSILLLLLLLSCRGGQSMKMVDQYIFLHDNSSKIWLIDKLLIEKNDHTPMRFEFRQVIAFHESRNAYIYRVDEMHKPGKKAFYWMDRSKNEFGFQFTQKEWVFEIVSISRTKVVLKPKRGPFKYTMVLIPFPER